MDCALKNKQILWKLFLPVSHYHILDVQLRPRDANTICECGLTTQKKQIQRLQQKKSDKDATVKKKSMFLIVNQSKAMVKGQIRVCVARVLVRGDVSAVPPIFNLRSCVIYHFIIAMSKILFSAILSLILTVSLSQTVNLSQIFTQQTLSNLGNEFNDPNFLKLIGNYFGCKSWVEGNCVECSLGYVFNKQGVCCNVDKFCQQYNTDVGICQDCYSGYAVTANGSCVLASDSSSHNGCAEWKKKVCTKCAVRYYFNADKVCTQVSDQCREWDSNGQCTSCYGGYNLDNGKCVLADAAAIVTDIANSDPLCAKWKGSVCQACAEHSFRNRKGLCESVNDYCNTWDKLEGYCLSCFQGYDLNNGTCSLSEANNAPPTDAGCKTWNKGLCKECGNHWIFNANGLCIPVSGQCKTWDVSTGDCKTCYRGYDLNNGECVYSESNRAKPTDGGCRTWDWESAKCTQCSTNWVFDQNGLCIPVSDLCKTSNAKGQCDSCYRGYELVNGSCAYSYNSVAVPDAGCRNWNYSSNSCQQCSNRWVLAKTGACVQVSDLCDTYSSESGLCVSCYKGYELDKVVCIFSPSNVAVAEAGCKSWTEGVCKECAERWVFNANGKCITVSDQCRTWDSLNAECTSCYRGYDLTNGSCLYSESNNARPTDGGCKTWDSENAKCKECSQRWVFHDNGICIPVSEQCRTSTSNGDCDSCYKGYDLVNGSCVFSPSNYAALPDAGCHIWNYTTKACETCSKGWYFMKDICIQSNTLCKSFDSAQGQCLSCYLGYDLVNGTCQFFTSEVAAPTDPGCNKIQNGGCVKCSYRWAFDANKVCAQVSEQCKTFEGLSCTSCYNGYTLNNGSCFLSISTTFANDAGCSKWDWTSQKCLACSTNWVFLKGVCVPVNDQCKTHDSKSGECTSCYKGYELNNGSCVSSRNGKPSDPGCADWNWDSQTCLSCGKYYVLKNGTCEEVSPFCKKYDSNGACTTCFTGYSLADGVCSINHANCKTQDNNGKCATCYNGFALYKGDCVELSSLANVALYYASCCPEKLAQLQAEGRIPK